MLLALAAFVLVTLCFILRELVGVHRELSSIRQFLEWSAVGFLREDRSESRMAGAHREGERRPNARGQVKQAEG